MNAQAKRPRADVALKSGYLEEGRLRYHSSMCTCCPVLPNGQRLYTQDFDPACATPFPLNFETLPKSVHENKRTCSSFLPYYSFTLSSFSLYLDFIIWVAFALLFDTLLHVLLFSFIFLSFRHHFRLYASVSKQEASSSLPESWFGSLQKLHGVCCCLVYFELYSTKLIIRFV